MVQPDLPESGYSPMIRKALSYIAANIDAPIGLSDLAEEVGCCRYYLTLVFKRELGETPMRWLWRYRTRVAALTIRTFPGASLIAISIACGFRNTSHFSTLFKRHLGMSPSSYRAAGDPPEETVGQLSRPAPGIPSPEIFLDFSV